MYQSKKSDPCSGQTYVTVDSRQETTNLSSTPFIPNIQLIIHACPINRRQETIMSDFEPIFLAIPFTHLSINCKDIFIEALVRIIHSLPNLNSLKVSWLPVIKSELPSLTSSNNNKIKKVTFKKMIDVEQVYFLLKLCVNMQYFQVHLTKYADLEMLVRFILMKISTYVPQLTFLSLYIPNANESMVHKLHQMIDSEKLLVKYTIKRICNNILFKWN